MKNKNIRPLITYKHKARNVCEDKLTQQKTDLENKRGQKGLTKW